MVAAVGLVGATAFSSCAYDPYYTSVGGSYSTGYGAGYGYGGSTFTTDVFVGTGNPRWGYDPHCYSYYDYNRRAYYDPYLNGYYPVGYRPQVVYGVSHPYGWRPGSGYCRPPSRVTNVTISNYSNRESAYRSSGYIRSGGSYSQRPLQGGYQGRTYDSYPSRSSDYIQSRGSYNQRPQYGGYNGRSYEGHPTYPSYRQQGRPSSQTYPREAQQSQRQPREMRQLSQPDRSRPPVQQTQAPRSRAPQTQNQQPPRNIPQTSRGSRSGAPREGDESSVGRWTRGL